MTIFIASRPHLMNVAQELTVITVIPACFVCEPTFTYNVVHCYLPQFSCKKSYIAISGFWKEWWIFRSKYVKSAIFRWIYKEVLSINLKLVARKKGLFQNAFKYLSICGKITFDAILQMIGFCAIGFFIVIFSRMCKKYDVVLTNSVRVWSLMQNMNVRSFRNSSQQKNLLSKSWDNDAKAKF